MPNKDLMAQGMGGLGSTLGPLCADACMMVKLVKASDSRHKR